MLCNNAEVKLPKWNRKRPKSEIVPKQSQLKPNRRNEKDIFSDDVTGCNCPVDASVDCDGDEVLAVCRSRRQTMSGRR